MKNSKIGGVFFHRLYRRIADEESQPSRYTIEERNRKAGKTGCVLRWTIKPTLYGNFESNSKKKFFESRLSNTNANSNFSHPSYLVVNNDADLFDKHCRALQ